MSSMNRAAAPAGSFPRRWSRFGAILLAGVASLLCGMPLMASAQDDGIDPNAAVTAPVEDLTESAERDRWLRAAERLIRIENYQEAAEALERAAAARPNDPAVLALRGRVELYLGRPHSATEFYRRALKVYPGHLEFRLGLAKSLTRAGDYDQAQAVFAEILGDRPGERRALLGSAQAYAWAGDYEQAIAVYERYLVFHEESVEGLMGLARIYSWSNRFSESIDIYKRIIASHPDYREAKQGMAQVLSWQGELEQARSLYLEMLHDSPGDLVLLIDYAKILAWMEDFGQASEIYDRVLTADRDNIEAMLGKARVLSWQGDLDSSEKIYDEVLQRAPENREAVMGKIQVLYWGGRPFKAGEFLEEYPVEKIQDAEYQAIAANVRLDLGETDEAAEIVESGLATTHPQKEGLLRRIRRSMEPNYFSEVQFLHDSENRQIIRIPHIFSFHPASGQEYRTRVVFTRLGEDHLDGISNLDVLLGYGRRLNRKSKLDTEVGLSTFNPGYSTGIFRIAWDFMARDGWAVRLAARRETFGWTARAIQERIVCNSLDLGVQHNWWRHWYLKGSIAPSRWSDRNWSVEGNIYFGHTFLEIPYNFNLSYHLRYSSFLDDLNNGYFDPQRYIQHSVIGEKGLRLGDRGNIRLAAETGLFAFDENDADILFKILFHVDWEAMNALVFRFEFDLFNSALRFDTGAYGSASYRLGLNYNF